MYTSDGVGLRALEPEDEDLLYEWENNPQVWHVSGTRVPFSRYQIREYLAGDPSNIYAAGQVRFMITYEGEAVGLADLFDYDPLHSRAGLGMLIASKEHKGKGIAVKALGLLHRYAREHLLLNQIYSEIPVSNTSSIAMCHKAGYVDNGIKKAWIRMQEGWEDVLFMQCFL